MQRTKATTTTHKKTATPSPRTKATATPTRNISSPPVRSTRSRTSQNPPAVSGGVEEVPAAAVIPRNQLENSNVRNLVRDSPASTGASRDAVQPLDGSGNVAELTMDMLRHNERLLHENAELRAQLARGQLSSGLQVSGSLHTQLHSLQRVVHAH